MFKIGDAVKPQNYAAAAIWCNKNNATIIQTKDGAYIIAELPELSEESKLDILRIQRNLLLEKTDKYMLSDFPIDTETKNKYVAYREYLRNVPQQIPIPTQIMTFEEYLLPGDEV